MANVRIKDLTTTAATTASDDFFGVDGATNGTRKLNAFSPTFGGNLTVAGGTARFQDPTNSYGVTITTAAAKTLVETLFGGSSLGIRVGGSGSDSLTIASTGATIRDNLTVSGGTITGGASGMSLAAGGTNQNITLTPSGTGLVRVTCSRATAYSSSLTGDVVIYNPDQTDNGYSSLAFGTRTSAGGVVDTGSAIASITTSHVGASFATQLAFLTRNGSGTLVEAGRFTNGGNLILKSDGVDSGNGKLQLADHITSAGGIGFGTDTSLYREAAGTLSINHSGGDSRLYFYNAGTAQGRVESASSNFFVTAMAGSLILRSGGATTALTLDSSQRAQFAGNIGLGAAPLANIGVRNSLSLTASGGSAYVYQSGGTLTSAANNDSIFGLSVDNAYSNAGSYTNVSAGHLVINARSFSGFAFGYGLRIGNITGATSNFAIRTGSGVVSFEDSTASTTTGTGALQVSGGAGIAGAVNVGTYYGMVDGVTAPSATSGYAKIYVDTADGDLKVIFGDGTIKTIATDT